MRAMSDDLRTDPTTRRDHLRLVAVEPAPPGIPPAARPRTIGRVIAQTALIADSAVTRRHMADHLPDPSRGMTGRLFGRFR